MRTLQIWVSIIFCFGLLTGCMGREMSSVEQGCAANTDCPGGALGFEQCDVASGLCLCLTDNACDANEFCNEVGSCQARAGCESNDDCSLGSICNVNNGECLELNNQIQCILDSHCPYGSVCQNYQCSMMCRQNGDCPPGQPCLNGACNTSSNACNLDNGNHYCDFGQICNESSNQCFDHAERSFLCESCDPYDTFACDGSGWCLIDNTIPPAACNSDSDCYQYGANATCQAASCLLDSDCGAGQTCDFSMDTFSYECSGGGTCGGHFCGSSSCDDVSNPCPRGYECSQLRIVSPTTCSSNSDCAGDRACQGGGENNNRGYCSCITDSDCSSLSFPDATCVNPGPEGACIVGTTCGPASGLTCDDLE